MYFFFMAQSSASFMRFRARATSALGVFWVFFWKPWEQDHDRAVQAEQNPIDVPVQSRTGSLPVGVR